ncbi:GMC oxidoreductase [Cyathus striatus]|nr:GMC oxidoreductase [Cyathus striatus]
MGLSHSTSAIVSDPAAFATQIHADNEDDQSKWRTYDYVVVGGGTAGIILATRLSEDPGVTVLLLEAGKSHEGHFSSKIPFAFNANFKTPADWDYLTAPQEHMDKRELFFPRGKLLGGCTSINAAIYHCCSPEDFDSWAKDGAEGWGYKDLLPYFKKSEGYYPSPTGYKGVNLEDRGRDGPWKITHIQPAPMNDVLVEACAKLGIPHLPDLNTDKGTIGASTFSCTVDEKGHRSSIATAYLTPAVLSRPNLTIGIASRVEKVLFSNPTDSSITSKPRAIGVELSTSATGPRFRVAAGKEVIVSSGAIGTPQVLLLSGVGPAEHLKERGVEVVRDLENVGKNLSDHLSCGSLALRTKSELSWNYLLSPLSGFKAFLQWYAFGTGPLRTLVPAGAAFVRSDDKSIPYETKAGGSVVPVDTSAGPNSPDLEIIWFPAIVLDNGHRATPKGVEGITISAIALRPSSTGQVLLKTTSIWDKPVIDANYFAEENDLDVVVRGTRLIMKLANTEPMKSFLVNDGWDGYDFLWPGHADPDQVTDAEIKDWIRKNGAPAWHPTSTARMGTSESNSVVDAQLRVHGVEGLRVVDASVLPTQVSGHTAAVVVAVAERAADLIKAGKV